MDISQIGYFLQLADTLNFTEAARRSGVSQPSLTRAMQRLEEELGGPLVYRDGRDTRLTALGRDIRDEFMRIDQSLDRVRELADEAMTGRRVVLNIGVVTTITPNAFSSFLDFAIGELSGVEINLHPMATGEDSDQVLSGKYDACILPGAPKDNFKLNILPLFNERLMVACAQNHPFAAQSSIHPDQLPHETYIDRLACEFHTQLSDFFTNRNILMRPKFSSEREDWVQHMVANSNAICILPHRSVQTAGLVARPVDGLTLSRDIVLVTVSGSGTPAKLRQLVKLAESHDWVRD